MSMTVGQKITAPFIRGTSRHGAIHALENLGTGEMDKSLCNRITMEPDAEGKRFQVGLPANCSWCEERVMIERSRLRNVKHNEAAKARNGSAGKGSKVRSR